MLDRPRSALPDPARERGASSAEYALIAGLIAVVIVTAVALLGGALVARYDDSASRVESAINP